MTAKRFANKQEKWKAENDRRAARKAGRAPICPPINLPPPPLSPSDETKLSEWLQGRKASTVENYRALIRRHVHAMGCTRLQSVTSRDIEGELDRITPVSELNTLRQFVSRFHSLFRYLARVRYIAHDPAASVPLPGSQEAKRVPSVPGIYKLTCTVDERTLTYVGQATSLNQRATGHRHAFKNDRARSAKLGEAMRQHGRDAFAFTILEYVSPGSDLDNRLHYREQFHIDRLDTCGPNGLNTCDAWGGPPRPRIAPGAVAPPITRATFLDYLAAGNGHLIGYPGHIDAARPLTDWQRFAYVEKTD